MGLNIDQVSKNIKYLKSQNDVIYTADTALSIYGKLPNYIQKPFSIINFENLNDSLELSNFYPIPTVSRIYSDDIFIINGIKLASPGKAMVDLLLSGRIEDIIDLLEGIRNSSEEITLKIYIQKYNLTNIIKNIIKNYNLEEFSDVLLGE